MRKSVSLRDWFEEASIVIPSDYSEWLNTAFPLYWLKKMTQTKSRQNTSKIVFRNVSVGWKMFVILVNYFIICSNVLCWSYVFLNCFSHLIFNFWKRTIVTRSTAWIYCISWNIIIRMNEYFNIFIL